MTGEVSTTFGPFPSYQNFLQVFHWLDAPDLGKLMQVCQLFNRTINEDEQIWLSLFRSEGLPRVVSLKGEKRNEARDFKVLYPITYSGRIIGEHLGKVVGEIPPIREEVFNSLNENDPFNQPYFFQKLLFDAKIRKKGEDYCFVVVPHLIQRTVRENELFALDENRDLVDLSEMKDSALLPAAPGEELLVRFSMKSIEVLGSHPLKRRKDGPVFKQSNRREFFEQCGFPPERIGVYLMRREIAPETFSRSYHVQEELVRKKGFEVTPIRERVLFSVLQMLQTGSFSDGQKPWTKARAPDIVWLETSRYHAASGCWLPNQLGKGICVFHDYHAHSDGLGVVPGLPASQ